MRCTVQSLIVWYRMAHLLKTTGNFQEAADIQLSIVTKRAYFPQDRAVSLHYAADALAALNRPLDALYNYRAALQAYPSHLSSYLGLVDTLLEVQTTSTQEWSDLLRQMYSALGREVVTYTSESSASSASILTTRSGGGPGSGPGKASSGNMITTNNNTVFNIPSAFYFAMFKAAHCLQEHDQAWLLLDKAHVAQKQEKGFSDLPSQLTNIRTSTLTIQNVFNAGFWPHGVGHPSVTPVFIVGMMRSGSTLLEHLLDAHSGLVGVGEDSAMNHFLPSLLKQIQECMQPPPSSSSSSPSNVTDTGTGTGTTASNYLKIKQLIHDIGDKVLTRMTNKALDARAINHKLPQAAAVSTVTGSGGGGDSGCTPPPQQQEEQEEHRAAPGHHPVHIIDKMLFNYRNIGLIHLVFPHAIILHTVRDPMDTLFGCYKQKFDDSGE